LVVVVDLREVGGILAEKYILILELLVGRKGIICVISIVLIDSIVHHKRVLLVNEISKLRDKELIDTVLILIVAVFH
jgi:hypothetical protein